ncbi:MAG: DUF2178 domain-containing protein [Dehalogenimonas sp.]|uniref:DUF2178 domain-containing protein n=1 Tax=Candidatus Dehalogenimonas loeffleri TaxID=3127115 RepID=A0ABZ2J402_9CHLR|nr:DUF2178 domain-containing protein [Dehalogenimonas sp.]
MNSKAVNSVSYIIGAAAILMVGNLIVMTLFDSALPFILIPFILALFFALFIGCRQRTGKIADDERVRSENDKSARNAFLAALLIFYTVSFEVIVDDTKF